MNIKKPVMTHADGVPQATYDRAKIGHGLPPASVPRGPLVQGSKADAGKEPLTLLSRMWMLGVARVLAFGAKKYSAHNWRKGLERSRTLDAAMRHILAYMEGEDLDPETGLNHLDHASCELMFAREHHETHPELDNRYKQGR